MMTLEEYAAKILKDSGCDCYTYGGAMAKHVLDDLKEAFPNGMENGYGYVAVANAILAMSKPEPIRRAPYMVLWETDSGSDGYGCDTVDEAKASAEDTLVDWMTEEACDWKGDRPTADDKERWDYMIYNCGVSVAKYNELTDEYDEIWSPSQEELDEIGWTPFDN